MDAEARKVFEGIKEKAEKDKLIWNEAQENEPVYLSPEKEDEIMERMFLVFYTEQYLKAQEKIKELEEQLSEAEGAICVFRED
ncbi:hypothetical protein [Bacillus sp. M6-12]|uniref:hypothetical protein n=1 Tax=Bacillus sp. M6-12 TaxID=2054166 RepID=UPI00115A6BDA|nr:hypothetical protein [Bacillus sp. M6-12]